jgi:hypothetical protein
MPRLYVVIVGWSGIYLAQTFWGGFARLCLGESTVPQRLKPLLSTSFTAGLKACSTL